MDSSSTRVQQLATCVLSNWARANDAITRAENIRKSALLIPYIETVRDVRRYLPLDLNSFLSGEIEHLFLVGYAFYIYISFYLERDAYGGVSGITTN